jgi:hypothetical protein
MGQAAHNEFLDLALTNGGQEKRKYIWSTEATTASRAYRGKSVNVSIAEKGIAEQNSAEDRAPDVTKDAPAAARGSCGPRIELVEAEGVEPSRLFEQR